MVLNANIEAHPLIAALRAERRRLEVSQQQMAEYLGYHATAVCSWERGRCEPPLRVLSGWAEAVGFEIVLRRVGAN